MAEGKMASYRWWAQGLAEGYVYLNEPDQALVWLDQAERTPLHPTEGRMQVAWERLTRGIALFQKGEPDKALDNLSQALEESLRANYSIIQCFAIPYIADILLKRGHIDDAESHVDTYFRIDPDSQYQLSACDARRVQALCKLARGERALAQDYASRAYRLAACDGPPFVYKEGLRRALDTLRECGTYVPRAEARLQPEWKRLLETFQSDSQQESANGAAKAGDDNEPESVSREKALELLRESELMREAFEQDRRWWAEITKDAPSAIDLPLARAMANMGITLEKFRSAFEASAHKSVLVVFYQLHAASIVAPTTPLPFGGLEEASARAWLENTPEHAEALTHFLSTEFAQRVAFAFQVHDLDKIGIRAFLNDNKRRIDYANALACKVWWDGLEQLRPPMDMLILAEAVRLTGLSLEEFVSAIATGTARGIEYAFAAILVKRAIQDLEVKAISRTEGWSDVQIFLRLEDVKQALKWREADTPAREFWASVEKSNAQQIGRVLQIAEELAIRGATIDDYYKAYLFSNTDNVQANLSYVDYVRLKDTAWDGTPTWSKSSGRPLLPEGAALGFSETGDWTEEQVKNRLGVLKTKLGYNAATESVRTWWTSSLESLHPPKVILRLVEELEVRAATLADLHLAQVDGATENIPAAFAYLDFTRVKLNAAQRARDLNRAGNTHFESKRYGEAVASYEAAIRESPDNEIFYTNLAGAWEQIDDIDRIEALEKAIQVLERGSKYCSQSESIRQKLKATKLEKRLFEQGAYTKAKSMAMLSVVTPIALEVASNLIPLAENEASGLLAQVPAMRERIRKSTGFQVPGVRFRGNEAAMPKGSYLIMIDEIPLVMGIVDLDKSLTTLPEITLQERGIHYERAVNPVDGSDAFWVNTADAGRISGAAWDAPEYIERHLEAVLVKNIGHFVTHETVTGRLRDEWGAQSREIAGDWALLGRFVRILRALLDERVSTVEFGPLCRAFLEKSREGANQDETLQALRMLPEIRPSLPGNQEQRLLGLSDAIEDQIVAGLHAHGDERLLALLPGPTQEIRSAVRTAVGSLPGSTALVVRNTLARRYMRKLVELEVPTLCVLAKAELDHGDTRKIESNIDLE
jgi:tetratricopeptide (TPR) repeat protein